DSLVVTPFAHFGAHDMARVARNATMDHQRKIMNEANAVLTLTSVERDGFARWRIHPKRVAVVGGGVDVAPPVDNGPGTIARLGLHHPFALFVGRANRDKGAIHAAQATLELAQNGMPLTLVLAGQVTEELQRLRRGLSVTEHARVPTVGAAEETIKEGQLPQS